MMPPRPGKGVLAAVRVLETGNEAARFAGWLLNGLGADVTRLEAPGAPAADPLGYLDAGKRRVTLDLTTPEGQVSFRDLVRNADVVIEAFGPGYLDGLELGYTALSAEHPGLVMASVTGFGHDGPHAGHASSELVAQAVGGWLSVTGEPARPVRLPGPQAHGTAALFAVNGILLALRHRRRTGHGQRLDISLQECAAAVLDHVLPRYAADGAVAARQGSRHWNNAFDVFPCADGRVLLSLHRDWDTLAGWLEAEGAAADLAAPAWRDENYRNAHIDHIVAVVTRWTKGRAAADIVATARLMRFPWAKVATVRELLDDPHLAARGFFKDGMPGVPFRLGPPPRPAGGGA